MKILNTLKRIDSKSLFRVILLSIKNPLFLYPTFQATVNCMRISTLHYGREHYKNTPANAFRHAFWNYLIAHNCSKWRDNEVNVLQWTKAITDWHENAFANRALPRAMDLHNNQIGRNVYALNTSQPLDNAIQQLLVMAQNAIKIRSATDIAKASDILVYICPSTETRTDA